jgi:23S rRNA pseudouridine2605 synthase
VRVNGTVVKEPGTQVDAERDQIAVHGRPIPGPSAMRYLMIHKPVGVITTLDDPEGRPTVRTLLPPGPRLFPVGRLDAETSGLLIATNDGELAHHLMHPRFGVRKVYRVRIDRPPDPQQVIRLRSGVEFEPRVVSAPCEVRVRNARAARAEIEIALHEGRYRQVRRMCEAVGLAVKGLHRSAYGPLRIGTLPRGAWRDLTKEEVRRLRTASERPVPRVPSIRRVRTAAGAPPMPVRPLGRPMGRGTSARPPFAGAGTRPAPSRPGARPLSRPPGDRPMPRFAGGRPSPRSQRTPQRFERARPPQRPSSPRPLARAGGGRPMPARKLDPRERYMGRDRMSPRPAKGRPAGSHPRGRPAASQARGRPGASPPRGRPDASMARRRPGAGGPPSRSGGPQARPRPAQGGPRMGQRTGRAGPPRPSGADRRPRPQHSPGRGRGGPTRPRPQGRPPRH